MTGTESPKGLTSPLEAHEMQTEYLVWRKGHPSADRLLHASQWTAQQNGLFESVVTLENREKQFADSRVAHNVWRLTDDEIISRADTVYLSEELHELVHTASESMPDEVLFRTDVYTPCAMVFLERPIQVRVHAGCLSDDIDEIVDKVRQYGGTVEGTRKYTQTEDGYLDGVDVYEIVAFSWGDCESIYPHVLESVAKQYGTASPEYKFQLELEHYEKKELNHARFVEEDGTEHPMNAIIVGVFGRIVSSEIDGLTLVVRNPLISLKMNLIDSYYFMYGEDGFQLENDSFEEVMNQSSFDRYRRSRRFIVALLRLMNEYVDVETTRVPRPFSRRGARAGRVNTDSITTLELRRALYGDSDSATGRKVSLAHLVRGHWRNQWYPSQQMHRARWINAHRRGGSATDEVVDKPRIVTVTR